MDNASSDGSIEQVPDGVDVLRLPRNEGFGPAVNAILPSLEGELVLILNPDAAVTPEAVDAMVACFRDPDVGAVQPLLVLPDDRLDSAGSYLTWTGFLAHPGHMESPLRSGLETSQEIFAAKGAALMVRTRDLLDVGGFDPRFFLYWEDTDLCWRLWLRGRRVVLCPQAVVVHDSGHVVRKRDSATIDYHSFRNRITTLIKNLSLPRLVVVLPLHLLACTAVAIGYVLLGRVRHAGAVVAAIGWNLGHLPEVLDTRREIRSRTVVRDSAIFALSYRRGIFIGPDADFVRRYFRRW